jgi:hypothetical protein
MVPRFKNQMFMITVEENTIVKVGTTYLVRCAALRQSLTCSIEWYIPIYGNIHKDPQLGVPWQHVHIDGRFLNFRHPYVPQLSDFDKGRTNAILQYTFRPNFYNFFHEIVLQPLKCVRLTTGINPPERDDARNRVGKYWNWRRSMNGQSCAGRKCPHMGTLMKIGKDGFLECPLHGLKGCPEKEIII